MASKPKRSGGMTAARGLQAPAQPSRDTATDAVVTHNVPVNPFDMPASTATAAPVGIEVRPGFKLAKAREVLPHVSVYLHPRVIAQMKSLAALRPSCRPHALYLEALDRYLLAETGQSLADLSRD